ncbi:hypothetical protein [Baekduia alba]|uniref:hypothetical protein n=1 Tax=Baekduia alba TaxID=2997333 RepID=UPI0023410C33|nr:hypothetical protein [Baekduia alba]
MRLRLRIATALALLLALCVALPTAASANTRKDIFHDCTDGQIDGSYSQKAYADALAHLPADVDEYTDCRSQIQRKQLGGDGGGTGGGANGGAGGGTGGGTTGGTGGGTAGSAGNGDTATAAPAGTDPLASATDAEKAAFQKAVAAGDSPIKLDGRPIYPGELGGQKSSGVSDLPAPLLAVLALLILAGIGAAGFGTRRLVLSRRTA